MFSIKTIESIAKIGGRTVYDLILQSETKEVENYCILVHKTPLAIGKTLQGQKKIGMGRRERTHTSPRIEPGHGLSSSEI